MAAWAPTAPDNANRAIEIVATWIVRSKYFVFTSNLDLAPATHPIPALRREQVGERRKHRKVRYNPNES
jgi:hypothetical protein